jgi:hypothetical protein
MVTAIPLGPGDEAVVRMPTPAERRDHRLGEGEPVIEIRRGDGTSEVHAARRTKVSAADLPTVKGPLVEHTGGPLINQRRATESGAARVEGDGERLEG